jgi:hypothetical protein
MPPAAGVIAGVIGVIAAVASGVATTPVLDCIKPSLGGKLHELPSRVAPSVVKKSETSRTDFPSASTTRLGPTLVSLMVLPSIF